LLELMERIKRLWCKRMHTSIMWPIHGLYRCSTCLREYNVRFHVKNGTVRI